MKGILFGFSVDSVTGVPTCMCSFYTGTTFVETMVLALAVSDVLAVGLRNAGINAAITYAATKPWVMVANDFTGQATAKIEAVLAADQATGANVTPVTLTDLAFNYEPNSIYKIFFMGRIQPAAATTGCGFQFDLSTAVTDINLSFYHQLANAGTLSGGHSIADDASVGVSSGAPGTSTYPVVGDAVLRTGANAGVAQLRFRSETTAVITAKAGMILVVEKVA